MAALGRLWRLLLAELAFCLDCGCNSFAFFIRTLGSTQVMPAVVNGVTPAYFATTNKLVESPLNHKEHGRLQFSNPLCMGTTSSPVADVRQLTLPPGYLASYLGTRGQRRPPELAVFDGKSTAVRRLGSLGDCGDDLEPDIPGHWRWSHEGKFAAFGGISTSVPYGVRHSGHVQQSERPNWFGFSSPLQHRTLACLTSGQDNGNSAPAGMARDVLQYPQDMDEFQQSLSRLDSRFLQISEETASPTAKNGEILQSLGMLWRQRRQEQRQEEMQQYVDGRTQASLYGSIDETTVGRKSGNAFRARAYKMAYEILHQSRIPIYNIAQVLLLLREGGILLRGEEANLVKRGTFRSAVLQKIYLVLSRGLGELIRQSRSVFREGALQELSRLPGVTRRTAAALFDDHLIDNAEMLRERLRALSNGAQESPQTNTSLWASQTPIPSDGIDSLGTKATSDCTTLADLFPTNLSRACIIHADAFGAAMDTAEFDEWQQQLLLVQQGLREVTELAPQLPLEPYSSLGTAKEFPSKIKALPVVSLGGGIFHGVNNKLISLVLQVSLLPSWTEEGLLPTTLDHAVCSGGQGASLEEIKWVRRQWEHVSQTYRALRLQLHRYVVDALKQRGLLAEVICNNSRTKITHAAGRLPWRQETYRLMTIQTVQPRAFPFATLASRCSASAYRLLQTRTRARWNCTLTPSGLTAFSPRKASTTASPSQTNTGVAADELGISMLRNTDDQQSGSALVEQALWVFDEQGVLRLLQEPLSMQERVGKPQRREGSL